MDCLERDFGQFPRGVVRRLVDRLLCLGYRLVRLWRADGLCDDKDSRGILDFYAMASRLHVVLGNKHNWGVGARDVLDDRRGHKLLSYVLLDIGFGHRVLNLDLLGSGDVGIIGKLDALHRLRGNARLVGSEESTVGLVCLARNHALYIDGIDNPLVIRNGQLDELGIDCAINLNLDVGKCDGMLCSPNFDRTIRHTRIRALGVCRAVTVNHARRPAVA